MDAGGQRFLQTREGLRWRVAVLLAATVTLLFLVLGPLNRALGLPIASDIAWVAFVCSTVLLISLRFLPKVLGVQLVFAAFALLIVGSMAYGAMHGYSIHHWGYLFPPLIVFLLRPRFALIAMIAFGLYTMMMTSHLLDSLDIVRFVGIYTLLSGFITTFALLEEEAGLVLGRQTEGAQQLRQLIDASLDAVVTMDDRGMVREWNASAERIFGWSAAEIIGQRLSDFIIPERYRAAHESGMRRYLSTGQGRVLGKTLELAALRRNGDEFPVELSLWDIKTEGGRVFGALLRDISQRKQAEQRLQQEEEKYRSVVENGSEGILIAAAGSVVYANPFLERVTGRSLDELRGKPFTSFIHPEDVGRVVDNYMRRLRGEPVEQHYEFRVLAADGKSVWVELSAVAIDWEGKPATLSFLTDVTDRRQLQEQLRASFSEREAILQNSIVGMVYLDAERKVRWVNSALESMFRLDTASVIGQPTDTFYPSREDYDRVGAMVAEAVAANRPFEIEMPLRRADGELFWAYVSGRGLVESGEFKGAIWAIMDISARKALEHELLTKTQEQDIILQSTVIGIGLIQAQRFLWANSTLETMFAYPLGRLQNAPVGDLFKADRDWAEFLPGVLATLDSRGSYKGELELRRADQTPIWVQLHGARLQSRNDAPTSLWTFVDITERKRAETELLNALAREKEFGQLKSRFVSMTSHEFRTPLAGILSSVDLLADYGDRLEDSEKVEIFEQMRDSVSRMARMLDNILLIGRGDAQTLRFSPAPLELAPFLRQLVNEATQSRPSSDERPAVHAELDGVDGEWLLDANLLRHILGNLLSNAVKYSPQGGNVTLRVAAEGDGLRFDVQDQGIGIPEADQKRLFESFHRASNVGNIAGTGLGLAIVKQSTDLHGGTIEVISTPGEGTCFRLHLPTQRGA